MPSHSDYGFLKKVFIKSPEAAFINQEHIDKQWEELNYSSRPELDKAIEEYKQFESLLSIHGAELLYFSENDSVSIDSLYCRDATIVTDHGVILCQMGKAQRIPESSACQADYESHGIPVLGEIKSPGTIEGGDVAWVDQHTLAVAHGYRTNDDGFAQLKNIIEPFNINLIQVELPHFKGPSDVFHLMSIFSPVDEYKAVVYSPLMPVRFRTELLDRGYDLIEVPEKEYDTMGCNVLAIAPSECIMVSGNPVTKARLEAAGCIIHEYDGEHISRKGEGGPTCLTRPLLRI